MSATNPSNLKVKGETWKQVVDRLANLSLGGRVKVGVLAGSGTTADGVGLVEIAAIHEFGSPEQRIPARSFLRSTFLFRRVNAMRTLCARLVRAIALGRMTKAQAFNALGSWAVAEVKNTITEIDIPPPLSQKTIDAKGSSKPLVDSGRLMNALSYELENV